MTFRATATGQFRHRIQLQRLTDPPERSATGEPLKSYAIFGTEWAAFRTLAGVERLAGQQVNALQTHEITIHYRSDVTPEHRILSGTRVFDIKDVRNVDEANIELRMRCTEVVE